MELYIAWWLIFAFPCPFLPGVVCCRVVWCGRSTPVCVDGQCAADLAPEGTACMNEFGSTGSCNSYGECIDFCANADCSDGNPCTEDICQLETGYCNWAYVLLSSLMWGLRR